MKNKQLVYNRNLEVEEIIFTSGGQGFGSTADDCRIHIKNRKTGAGVRIEGDLTLEKLVFWAATLPLALNLTSNYPSSPTKQSAGISVILLK